MGIHGRIRQVEQNIIPLQVWRFGLAYWGGFSFLGLDQIVHLFIISIRYMNHEPTATVRARRLRGRRARGVALVAPIEVGAGGIELLVSNGLLKKEQTRARKAVGGACLAALEQWAMGHGAGSS